MSIEAMKLWLEALENTTHYIEKYASNERFFFHHNAIAALRAAIEQAQQERNFCPRCGKRLGKNDWDVHTCTSPQEGDKA